MANANLAVNVATSVEMEVGPKTAAWLVSLGWTAPVATPAEADPAGADTALEAKAPSSGAAEAQEAFTARQAGLYQAQQLRAALKLEISSPERIDQMLNLAGISTARLDAMANTNAPTVA